MRRRSLLAVGALAAALFVTPAFAQPRTITDAAGREVTLPGPARRVVVGFNFEEYTAIGGPAAWDRAVGISRFLWEGWRGANWERFTKAIPRIAGLDDVGSTSNNTFSVEKVIALKPDLLILPVWAYTAIAAQLPEVERAGIPILVVDYNAQKVAKHVASTLAIGAAIGAEDRARILADEYATGVRDVLDRIARHTGPRPTIHFELGQAGAATIGNSYAGTMWGAIADLLGARNIANGKLPGPWGPLNPEYVIAADPAHIFIAGSSWADQPNAVRTGYPATPEATRASLAPYAARPGWQGLSAIRAGNIHAIEHGLARTLLDLPAIQYIAKRLYPAQFTDVDPEATLRAYHERWLPVAYEGTWFLRLKP